MPLEIQTIETAAIIYYVMGLHSKLALLLLERKSSSLSILFEDALEVEENICASRKIPEQFDFENHHLPELDKHQYESYFEQEDYESEAYLEQQQACELLLDLESDSSLFAKYSQDRYESGFYDQFANQDEPMITDDCIGNYMFSTDLYSYDVNPILSSYYEHYSQKEILMIDDQDLIVREQEGHHFFSR